NTSDVGWDWILVDTQIPSGSITLLDSRVNGLGQTIVGDNSVKLRFNFNDVLKNSYASGVEKVLFSLNNAAATDIIGANTTSGGAAKTFDYDLGSFSLSNGVENFVTVNFVDYAGNQKTVTTAFTVVAGGLVATASSAVTINNGDIYTNTINVKLSLKSTNAVSMNISNSAAPGGWINYAEHNNSYAWALTTGDGLKTVYVRYRDALGNEVTVTDDIILDTTVPTGGSGTDYKGNSFYGVVINAGDEWTNTLNVTLNIKAQDANGITSMNISNTPNVFAAANWREYKTTVNNWLLLDDGKVTKTVYVLFMDAAGNTSNSAVSDNIKYDNVVPNFPDKGDPDVEDGNHDGIPDNYFGVLINGGDLWTNTLNVTLNLSATDNIAVTEMNISNYDDFRIGADTTGWINYAVITANWPLLNNSGVTKTVYVKYRDAAGNVSAVVTDDILFNDQRPTGDEIDVDGDGAGDGYYGIVINGGDEWTNILNVTLNIRATSNIGQVISMNISNYNDFSNYSTGWIAYAATVNNWLLRSDGDPQTKNVYIKFRDAAGNESLVFSDSIKYDITAPQNAGVLINNGQPKTISPTVNLTLTANPVADVQKIWLSNSPDFTNKTEINGFVSGYSGWNLGGSGVRFVYAKFIDAVGNSVNVQDDIIVDTSLTLLEFIEPDGINDVASDNFTISWKDYPQLLNDPAATISLWAEEDSSHQWHLISQNILFDDPVNGVIWDTRALQSGTYNISAVINSVFGTTTADAKYPVYIVHQDNPGDVGPYPPGHLPSNPPSVLVIEPSRDVQAGQTIRIVWDDENTPGDGSLITIYYDTDTDPANGRTLITANIDADDLADFYDWLADNVPEGEYYICVEISDGTHTNYDYSSGKVIVPKPAGTDSNDNGGGTDEPIYSYPNPFSPKENETAHIVYRTDKDGWTKVYIYNIRGQRIWQTDRFARRGENTEVLWDGRDMRGVIAPNGIYILMLANEKKHIIAKGRLTLYD
ncbi:hypothetical protein NO1_1312, partial [Candidatus Termititenax aidoneus]